MCLSTVTNLGTSQKRYQIHWVSIWRMIPDLIMEVQGMRAERRSGYKRTGGRSRERDRGRGSGHIRCVSNKRMIPDLIMEVQGMRTERRSGYKRTGGRSRERDRGRGSGHIRCVSNKRMIPDLIMEVQAMKTGAKEEGAREQENKGTRGQWGIRKRIVMDE